MRFFICFISEFLRGFHQNNFFWKIPYPSKYRLDPVLFFFVNEFIHLINPLTEVERNTSKIESLENPSSKKMSFGQILYYDGYGSYDFPEKFLSMKPQGDRKKQIRKMHLQRIWQRRKWTPDQVFTMTNSVVMISQRWNLVWYKHLQGHNQFYAF